MSIKTAVKSRADLPPFDASKSDGCSMLPWLPRRLSRKSIQRWLLRFFVRDVAAALKICCDHDCDYYYGGTSHERFESDERWLRAMLQIDKTRHQWFSNWGFRNIRDIGGPETRIAGVSWGHGGSRFVYDDEKKEREER